MVFPETPVLAHTARLAAPGLPLKSGQPLLSPGPVPSVLTSPPAAPARGTFPWQPPEGSLTDTRQATSFSLAALEGTDPELLVIGGSESVCRRSAHLRRRPGLSPGIAGLPAAPPAPDAALLSLSLPAA